ncbi:Histidine phosphatase superfamily clade-2 [Penicillium capsulatum]|uniref:Histidine phosphatase superfamily clade-2 n=1 Tax=Penicillium capsulatum TaxID=69766 RepID=A0A9W9LM64_9EURO|nr:Histidine phosphatase superfamily clade-2 [Penicillium capsulatum]KAJ6108722.1 Histidine phosphatase superfamily clade-2 [Penicillium capsulatum]
MHAHRQLLVLTALLLQMAGFGAAQEYTERVWSVFAYTTTGDSTPSVLVQHRRPAELSMFGANQLEAAGSIFRDRYITSTATDNSGRYSIQYIMPNKLNSEYVAVFTSTEQTGIASAQAFMQGLYPPVNDGNETLANGSSYNYPLDGYQYPRVVTLGESDPQSLILAGSAKCDMHQAAVSEYEDSSLVQQMTRETNAFYVDLWNKYLSGVYDKSSATYTNAVGISQYLDYEALHNKTMRNLVTPYELQRARWLADQYVYATNSQGDMFTGGSTIGVANPIAGDTLAASILQAFNANIGSQGVDQKMTLLFGGDGPAVALASLIGLASDQHSNFYSRLVQGGSLVFELYSLEAGEDLPIYPGKDDLFVRFVLHNGTDSDFTSYPLFGYGPSRIYLKYSEFQSELETFAVSSIREWCLRCNSASVFCGGVLGHGDSTPRQKKQMAPAVAGVVGAVVTLVVIGILAAIFFLVCGFRKLRGHKASVGGFKGDQRLASDTDVSFRNPIWGASKSTATEQQNDISTDRTGVHGHERMGSWEMTQQRKETGDGTALTIDDTEETLPSGLQPVKVRETV